jgi:hypothetical protein
MRAPPRRSASWDWTARHLLLAVGSRFKAVSLTSAVSLASASVKDVVDLKPPRQRVDVALEVERPTFASSLDVRPAFR